MDYTDKSDSEANARRSEAAPGKGVGTAKDDGIEVVLVDDSVLMRERVAASVRAVKGVTAIRQAGDVAAGLLLLEAGAPAVVLLDIEMPGQSGLEFLEIARRRGCAAVIIILSIHDYPKLRQRCADLGADFYFHKLTEFEQVAEVCRGLAQRRARRAGWFPR